MILFGHHHFFNSQKQVFTRMIKNFLRLIFIGIAAMILTKSINAIEDQMAQTIAIGFAGDVMLGRLVNEALDTRSATSVWGSMHPFLTQNDLNLVNLENAFTKNTHPVPKVFNFKADPEKASVLTAGNIHVVSLANNHSLDFGPAGLADTLVALDKHKIFHVGAGNTIDAAQKPVIIELKNIKIGILGTTDNEPGWRAGTNKPGTNYCAVGDMLCLAESIKKIRPQVDMLILSIHWGPNMQERPTKEFQHFAHQLIDAGVDILHGHSAHIVQGIEIYKNKLILYDNGDFVDDYAIDPVLRNDLTALFVVTANKKNVIKVQIIPAIIEDMRVNKISNPEERKKFLSHLNDLSKEFGSSIDSDGFISKIKEK